MRTEDLRLTYVGLDIDYPTLPKFTGEELPAFYNKIHRTHAFDVCDTESGELSTEDERRFVIARTEIKLQEQVNKGFEIVKKNATNLIEEACKHFGIRFFRVGRMVLRATWQANDDLVPVATAIRERVLKLGDEHFKFLGAVETTDLTFVGDSEDPDRHWHVALSAHGTEENEFGIEVELFFYSPLEQPSVVGEMMQIGYDFLQDNVTHFVNSFMEG
jgi:hypothetical protein